MNHIEQKIEQDVDCVIRDLESLIDRQAFKEVRLILRHATDYMAETIEALEELDQSRGIIPSVHRQSA
jgi:hypothetical protein